MAAEPSAISSTSLANQSPHSSNNQANDCVSINAAAQLPVRLTPENYFTWRAQFLSLAFGYNLTCYIDGTSECPSPYETGSSNASSTTSKQAWDKLARLYSNRSRSRVISLRERLARPRRDGQPVAEYLNNLRSISDEITLIDVPVTDDDLVIQIINGVGKDFKEIIAGVRIRETPLSFDELYEKLVDYEDMLKREEKSIDTAITVNAAVKQQTTNRGPYQNQRRDSNPRFNNGSNRGYPNQNGNNNRNYQSQNRNPQGQYRNNGGYQKKQPTGYQGYCQLFGDLRNLSTHSPYHGSDSVIVGNGMDLGISHTGSTSLCTSSSKFYLQNILYVPTINRNLISVSQFCNVNKASIEFFHDHFQVKDLSTGAVLLQGRNNQGVYEWPAASSFPVPALPTSNATIKTNAAHWHQRLGHQSRDFLKFVLRTFNLSSHLDFESYVQSGKIYVSRDVQFIESQFPYQSLTSTASPSSVSLTSWFPSIFSVPVLSAHSSFPGGSHFATLDSLPPSSDSSPASSTSTLGIIHNPHTYDSLPPHVHAPVLTPSSPISNLSSPTPSTFPLSPTAPSPSPPTPPPPLPTQTHPMITRSRNNIYKPKQLDHTTLAPIISTHPLPSTVEPTSIKAALADPQWLQAMRIEYNALISNHTWDLVPPVPSQNLIGCKWVFRVKRHPNGSVDRYKARLVAKGFTQRPGLDYHDTFSPVVKTTTVRVILCLALRFGWPIRQLDINNAFLNGSLDEEVYMKQPPGFIDSNQPSFVCRLRKSLYGLKQAPRAWFITLYKFLLSYGFRQSKTDASLFLYHRDGHRIYFLVYVDDLIITGSHGRVIQHFIHRLVSTFALKDLGSLHHFLGLELLRTPSGVFLSQHHYVRSLLDRFGMTDAKPIATPLSTTVGLQQTDGSVSADGTSYRQLLGALQYLTLTRPDICFAVNKLSQFMQSPSQLHWQAAKRILRYFKAIIFHGLFLRQSSSSTLAAYSDSDWGGNLDDRSSTSAYAIFLGGNLISWSSKKQKSVARSSTEAEFRAIAATVFELCWLRHLFSELGIQTPMPKLLCDNLGATHVCTNPRYHSRMKHVEIDFYFVRDKIAQGLLSVAHVPSEHQLADTLTKPLPRLPLEHARSKLGVLDGTPLLQGRNS
ncbi:retrovirus-related pol polyprotein from transposon RE1 [Citrus sinensis]|nr:retrovirus-related pol polyprotein from transposon RE1 [Citrus sinensis]